MSVSFIEHWTRRRHRYALAARRVLSAKFVDSKRHISLYLGDSRHRYGDSLARIHSRALHFKRHGVKRDAATAPKNVPVVKKKTIVETERREKETGLSLKRKNVTLNVCVSRHPIRDGEQKNKCYRWTCWTEGQTKARPPGTSNGLRWQHPNENWGQKEDIKKI